MRPGGGKAKGASFERDICRRLSLWVSRGVQEDVFWRSAMSGGRSTIAHGKGKRLAAQAGDISCIHPIGQVFADKFFIECKDYRDLNFMGLIKGTGNLVQFWAEACVQSRNYKKEPLLIAHQSRQPTIICTSNRGCCSIFREPARIMVPKLGMHINLFEEVLSHDIPDHLRPSPD